jgi:hypothetical protein
MPEWLRLASNPLGPLNRAELLKDSVYYPACRFDGRPIHCLAGNYHSFVYADYQVELDHLTGQLETFKEYSCLASRPVDLPELAPEGWCRLPRRVRIQTPRAELSSHDPRFARWAVFERKLGLGDAHGPKRFSLLHVGGEAGAAFRSLYVQNNCKPDVVVIIAAGEAELREERSALGKEVLCRNSAGAPRFVLGEVWEFPLYEGTDWPTYGNRVDVFGRRWTRQRGLTLWKRDKRDRSGDY